MAAVVPPLTLASVGAAEHAAQRKAVQRGACLLLRSIPPRAASYACQSHVLALPRVLP